MKKESSIFRGFGVTHPSLFPGREENQDAVLIVEDHPHGSKRGNLYAVADGIGGAPAGATAANHALRLLKDSFYQSSSPEISEALVTAVEQVNRQIYDLSADDAALTGMGCTLSAAVVRGDDVYFAHLGDSRIYIFNQSSGLRQLTRDNLDKEGRLTESIGAGFYIKVQTGTTKLASGGLLLLCTDGLSRFVASQQVDSVLRSRLSIDKQCLSLVETAVTDMRAQDNVSVLIVGGTDLIDPKTIKPQQIGGFRPSVLGSVVSYRKRAAKPPPRGSTRPVSTPSSTTLKILAAVLVVGIVSTAFGGLVYWAYTHFGNRKTPQNGDVVEVKICDWSTDGVAAELDDGLKAFIPTSNLHWTKIVRDPSESELIVKGSTVDAMVMAWDSDLKRFVLSLKDLKANPWAYLREKYAKGNECPGKDLRWLRPTRPDTVIANLGEDVEAYVPTKGLEETERKKLREAMEERKPLGFVVKPSSEREERIVLALRPDDVPPTPPPEPPTPPPEPPTPPPEPPTPPPEPPTPPPEIVVVDTIIARDAISGDPIRDAEVVIGKDDKPVGTTDRSGRVEVALIQNRLTSLMIRRDGYAEKEVEITPVDPRSRPVDLHPQHYALIKVSFEKKGGGGENESIPADEGEVTVTRENGGGKEPTFVDSRNAFYIHNQTRGSESITIKSEGDFGRLYQGSSIVIEFEEGHVVSETLLLEPWGKIMQRFMEGSIGDSQLSKLREVSPGDYEKVKGGVDKVKP